MLCYQACRLIFVLRNPIPSQDGFTPSQTLVLFLQGFRFDAAALVLLNAPFLALYLASVQARRFQVGRFSTHALWTKGRTLVWVMYLVTNVTALLVNVADVFYFPFSGKRSSLAAVGITQDFMQQLPQLLVHFWPVSLITLALGAAFVGVDTWACRPSAVATSLASPLPRSRRALGWHLVTSLSVIAMATLLGRGGLQRKPLAVASAYTLVPAEGVPAVLNTTFSVLKSLGQSGLPTTRFYLGSADELRAWQQARVQTAFHEATTGRYRGRNVMILVLESFGREYMGDQAGSRPCYVPFVCELSQIAVQPEPSYANGRTSIESFYSIHAGIPSLLGEPLVTSAFGAVPVPGLAARLQKEGYSTVFFHGGRNGTMFFDAMALGTGFARYVGLKEYLEDGGDPSQQDGVWGVFDGPFLQFALNQIDDLPKPFFASVFTLSSHNPYVVPQDRQGRYPKGTLPIHESLGYADESLRDFFAAAATRPWFKNTLFILTADHASISDDSRYQSLTGAFRIPLLLVDPQGQDDASRLTTVVVSPGQQIDIPPTVIDALGLPPMMESFFGRRRLNPKGERVVVARSSDLFWATNGIELVKIEAAQAEQATSASRPQSQLERSTRALIQSYFDALKAGSFLETATAPAPP
jgi:hypothetical protein